MTHANVLICEDEKIIAKDISLTLEKKGHHITNILNKGDDSITSIETERPDIVLMDIGLSGRWDGIKTAKIIKRKFDIPCIFITSHADDFILNKAKKAKPYAFICKPFKDLELCSAIDFGIQRYNLEKLLKKKLNQKASPSINEISKTIHNSEDIRESFEKLDLLTLGNEISNYISHDLKTNLSSMISHIEELSQDNSLNQLQKHKVFATLFKYQKIINYLDAILQRHLN